MKDVKHHEPLRGACARRLRAAGFDGNGTSGAPATITLELNPVRSVALHGRFLPFAFGMALLSPASGRLAAT
jgi:hypothetical protein